MTLREEDPKGPMADKIIKSGLVALCGLALLVQHIFDQRLLAGDNLVGTGDNLVAEVLMLTAAVVVWCLPSEPV